MSSRACKELINEDFVAELKELRRQVKSFENLFDQIDKMGDDGMVFYQEAIALDRQSSQEVRKTSKAYAILRLKVAEAID